MLELEHTVKELDANGCRLDLYLSRHLGLTSRSQLKSRITTALVNGKACKLSRRIKVGDVLEIRLSEIPAVHVQAENIPLHILYEDKNVIVLNKPQGTVVHPAKGHSSGTLVNGLLFYLDTLRAAFPEQEMRPGIVHRLDKDTSGVIVCAKNAAAHEQLALQFRKRRVRKTYLAVVKGSPPERSGRIDTKIRRDPRNRKRFACSRTNGKRAVTFYKVLRSYASYSLLMLRPRTGRTHQLRVHTRHLRCPILGDPTYSRRDSRFPEARLMLHAYRLRIGIPGADGSDAKRMVFKAPVPERFKHVLRRLARS